MTYKLIRTEEVDGNWIKIYKDDHHLKCWKFSNDEEESKALTQARQYLDYIRKYKSDLPRVETLETLEINEKE